MNKLKSFASCLGITAIAGAFLPAFAGNLFDADSPTTIGGSALTELSISCPAGVDAFSVHSRTGCSAVATFADKRSLLLGYGQPDSVVALTKGLLWHTDNAAVALPAACGTTGCFNPVLSVDSSVVADASVKVSATLTLDGVTKTASTSVQLYAPIALKVSCPSTMVSGGKVQIFPDPLQGDTLCSGRTYFSDGVKADLTTFLKWSASDTVLATVTNPSVITMPPREPSPSVIALNPSNFPNIMLPVAGTIQAATVTADSKVNIQATVAGLAATVPLQITVANTRTTPASTPLRPEIACPPVVSAGNLERCYAGIRVSENFTKLVNVKWSSSDSSLVSIDGDGKITAGKVTSNSKATITASYSATDTGATTATGDSAVTASTTVQVIPASTLSDLIVNCSATLIAGATGNCRAGAVYSDDQKKSVTPTWTSSDTAIATVDANGKVTAKSVAGKSGVTITGSYTEGGITKTASDTITVSPASSTQTGGDFTPLGSVTIECFFAWAETQYPELFPTSSAAVMTVSFGPYSFRSYPINKTYLGVETLTNTVIYVGPFSGGSLLRLGTFSSVWAKPSNCK